MMRTLRDEKELLRRHQPQAVRRHQGGLEAARRKTAPRKVDLYDVFCAVLYVLRTACPWRALPADLPKWPTVHSYWKPGQ